MAEGDGAAADVDAGPVPAERAAVGQRLDGERLIGLDQFVVPIVVPAFFMRFCTARIGAKKSSLGSPPPVA